MDKIVCIKDLKLPSPFGFFKLKKKILIPKLKVCYFLFSDNNYHIYQNGELFLKISKLDFNKHFVKIEQYRSEIIKKNIGIKLL